MEYQQREFSFIEEAKTLEKQSQLEAIIGGFVCAVLGASLVLGQTYLKLAKPKVLEDIKTSLEKVYPIYTGPY